MINFVGTYLGHIKMDGIYGFFDGARFLSNFTPVNIFYGGIHYPSTEHAYQASKCAEALDKLVIASMPTPGKAKRAGRDIKIRDDWDEIKLQVMEDLQRLKYQDPELRERLLETDTLYIEETNTWGDTFWGVCKGVGQNHLGKILMKIRDELKES